MKIVVIFKNVTFFMPENSCSFYILFAIIHKIVYREQSVTTDVTTDRQSN